MSPARSPLGQAYSAGSGSPCRRRLPAASLLIIAALAALILLPVRGAAQPPPAAEQNLALSWRVGTDIDELEREYFGLFPKVNGYRNASARRVDGAVEFAIRRSPLPDTVVRVTSAAFAELARYVDSMESVRAGAITIDWSVAPRVDGSNPYGDGRKMYAVLSDDSDVEGLLATIDERGVTLWTGGVRYSPHLLRRNLVVIPFAKLNQLTGGSAHLVGLAVGASLFGAVAGYVRTLGHEPPISMEMVAAGTVVGGLLGTFAGSLVNVTARYTGTTLTYADVARLAGEQVYYRVAPPEFRAYADSIFDADRTVRVAETKPTFQYMELPLGPPPSLIGASASIALAPSIAVGTQGYTVVKSFDRTEPGVYMTGSLSVRAEASYDVFKWLSIGVGYSYRRAVRSDTTDNSEWSSAREPLAFIELSPFFSEDRRRLSVEPTLAFGGGYMYALYTAQLPSASGGSRRLIESQHDLPLALARLGLVLNSSTHLALFFGIETRFIRAFTVPMYEYRSDPRPAFRYKWVNEHEVNLSTLEIQLGARVRM